MGETEDEFERAILALEAIERGETPPEPLQGGSIEEPVPPPTDLDAVTRASLVQTSHKTFMSNTIYKLTNQTVDVLGYLRDRSYEEYRQSNASNNVVLPGLDSGVYLPLGQDPRVPIPDFINYIGHGGEVFVELLGEVPGIDSVLLKFLPLRRPVPDSAYEYLIELGLDVPPCIIPVSKYVFEENAQDVDVLGPDMPQLLANPIPDKDILNSAYMNKYMAIKEQIDREEAERREEEERRRAEANKGWEEFKTLLLQTTKEVYEPENVSEITMRREEYCDLSMKMDEYSGREQFILGIKFPEITITNSRGQSHNIKDLYVAFFFYNRDGEFKIYPSIFGLRAYQTAAEYYSYYRHSHLSNSNDFRGNFSTFCLGGDTPTSFAMANLSDEFNFGMFELFLHQLGAYIEHESISGGPYIRMENIVSNGGREVSRPSSYTIQNEVEEFLTRRHNNGQSLPIKMEKVGGKEVISLNENDKELQEELVAYTQHPCVLRQDGTIVLRTDLESGDNMSPSSAMDLLIEERFTFNGQHIDCVVVPDNQDIDTSNWKIVPYPELVNKLKETVNTEINQFYNNFLNYELE